ncbi:phage portal protein [Rhodococcus maanshanensis]|uniref:phage portal protein n=1 Tax=Rhodococcus maanshanensis TaxID=183556 RepID=UPI0022B4B576|nr:phage portal protein [Rhodococcus maanshanensis]MCZ4557976.1 phage portal protein [Rhodococcus maanshanensis]
MNSFATCQAWWEGNAAKLIGAYGDGTRSGFSGFVQRVRRMFWSTPTTDKDRTRQLHIPIAADIVQTSRTLLMSEQVKFEPAEVDDNPEVRKRVDLILNSSEMHAAMQQAAESCAALGGVYGRIVWDSAVQKHAWVDFVDADQAIPEFIHGKLSAVTVWEVLDSVDNDVVWRHLEHHQPGRIYHGLYRGTSVGLGRLRELSEHKSTASIPVNEEGFIPTGVDGLTATYIPNALPNPEWRGKGDLANLGRSDISDPAVVQLMDQIDETYSSLARDVRLAKARLLASEHLLDSRGPGKGAQFDTEQEVFVPMSGAPNGAPVLEAHQFGIRVDDHLRTAEGFLRAILRRVGYSPHTFGMVDAGGAMTATEVDAKRDASVATHKSKSGLWKSGLAGFCQTLIQLDAIVFETGAVVTEPLNISWPPAARESPLQRAQTVESLDRARAISLETKVDMLWPEWDNTQRADEVKRIRAEQALADPYALGDDTAVDPVADVDAVVPDLFEPTDEELAAAGIPPDDSEAPAAA